MSEITQLTEEIRSLKKDFQKVGNLVSGHVEFIKTYRNEVETINKTLYNDKNGMVSRMKGVETVLKGKQSAFTRTTSVITLFFMGGMFIMWLFKTIASAI